jgi:RHS repeat-associated protein
LDEETGLYYYGARYYDPRVSMFYGVDVLAEERSWLSPFNYVQNNPLNRIDPDGALCHEWNYNTITGEKTLISDMGGNEVQFINFGTPHEDGGMTWEGTAVVEGSKAYAGPIRGGWGASSRDLWAGLSGGYNVNSVDFLKGGNYEYSLLDLNKRFQINNSNLSNLKNIIAGFEVSGNAQPIHGIEFRRQYAAKWETDKSFWFAIESGYWSPADLSSITDKGLNHLKNFKQAQRAFNYTPLNRALLPGKVSGNSWNQFLKETKGTYKGHDWLRNASNDYKIWKQAKGL